ncbi:hypothetical protein JZ751_023183, partial [Albula glossodonta]
MATQVETLLPNNPLLKQEEHGHASKMKQGEECLEKGAKQTSTADEESKVKGGDSEQGVFVMKEQSKKQVKDESNNQEKENLDKEATHLKDTDGLTEEDMKCNKKEFAEAPPPKVNPWTKKMNAVTVVSVNGQAHHAVKISPGLPSLPVLGLISGDFAWAVHTVLEPVSPQDFRTPILLLGVFVCARTSQWAADVTRLSCDLAAEVGAQ